MDNITVQTKDVSKYKVKKKIMYQKERLEILHKLNSILGITETHKSFALITLDNNPEMQKQINDLGVDVKKYFKCADWTYFCRNVKKKYLSLVKSIYKDMGYEIEKKSISVLNNDVLSPTQYYTITKF